MTGFIDIENIRTKFPVTKNIIYFDHAAVAPIHAATMERINEYLDDVLNFGDRNYKKWFDKSELVRKDMATFIGADQDEIAFIKNTSHGLSIVANGLEFKQGENVVIPDIEFPANVYPWMSLERKGVDVKYARSVRGEVPLESIESAIDINTKVVSVSSVEYSSGYRTDLKAISDLCKAKGEQYGHKIYFCVDAIQTLGMFKMDVKELGIDFLSADGHKWFLTPEGIGIFYCSNSLLNDLYPVTIGWKSVENPLDFSNIEFDFHPSARKFEEGSFNMMGIMALEASLSLFNSIGMENVQQRILTLTRLALDALQEANYDITSPIADCHRSGIITFKVKGSLEETFKYFIDNNIQLSMRGGNIRISPHFYNTADEVQTFKSLLR